MATIASDDMPIQHFVRHSVLAGKYLEYILLSAHKCNKVSIKKLATG